ncbi:type II secretion system F family protein [Rathayibacter sp. YIM 133350]|uniref:type II secretion system F family protein n=1 Tax=Rathayibacter sp. YIM 133350 TaxID=3131992 RepID=UPI00307DA24A
MSLAVIALGCCLGAGALLVASPWLWPGQRGSATRSRRPGVLRSRLALAGLRQVPPAAFIAASAIIGLLTSALALALFDVMALAAVVFVLGAALPSLLITWRARRRRAANRTVWPDVVDHLVAAVRAGLALPDAVASLGRSGPAATRSVFTDFEREYRATGDFGHCLDDLKDALADPVADRLVETLRMAREVGGSDLGDVLRGLAAYLREDAAVRAELRARQSWVVSAARLGVVAPWVVLLLLVSRPEGAAAYNSPSGGVIILLALVVSALAYRLMIRVGRLPEEQRWFR